MVRRLALLGLLILGMIQPVCAGEVVMPPPRPDAVCPVCGMFVAKYPEWVAAVVYRDGHAHYFDGAKDLFKFLLDPRRYVPGHRPEDVVSVVVTDYYAVVPIDAHDAVFVIGSDVLGPMGHELVPLGSDAEAAEFRRDHGGSATVRFAQVTPDLLTRLDAGQVK